ncbi:MAG TPA: hypothetical protein V6D17_18465 [Candidatus Obscuribacterales bacterium]
MADITLPSAYSELDESGQDDPQETSSLSGLDLMKEGAKGKAEGQSASRAQEIIGTASMDSDGAITLHLHAHEGGIHGEARLRYGKMDKQYVEILNHLKGLRPGETRLVTPFPDRAKKASTIGTETPGQETGAPDVTPPAPSTPPPAMDAAVAQEVKNAVDRMEDGVKKLLQDKSISVIVTPSITTALPKLAGQQPRGWPAGTTWDSCDGAFDPGTNTAVVAAQHWEKGAWTPNTSPAGITRHEVGHGVNFARGFSAEQAFRAAHGKDEAQMPPDAKKRLEYFIQPGHAGEDETFAEVFALEQGGTSYPGYQQDISTYFPNVRQEVRSSIAGLPKTALPARPTQPILQPTPGPLKPPPLRLQPIPF